MCESFSIIQPVRFMKVLFLALPLARASETLRRVLVFGHYFSAWPLPFPHPPTNHTLPSPQLPSQCESPDNSVLAARGGNICIRFFSSPLVLLLLYCFWSVYCGVCNNTSDCRVHVICRIHLLPLIGKYKTS